MKISKIIQKEETVEMEIETPCWYKCKNYDDADYYQVISEKDVTKVEVHKNWTTIDRLPYSYIPNPHKIFDGEIITENEFTAALTDAVMKVCGVEIAKEIAA